MNQSSMPRNLLRAHRSRGLRGLFVTATDTGVGKTIVASAIAATLAAHKERIAVFKPAVTGLAEVQSPLPDHELLLASAGSPQTPSEVAPYRFDQPVSPHLAAELSQVPVRPAEILAAAWRAAARADILIVEGVGGLMVPLSSSYLVRDFAVNLGLPVVIVARPGLGTINHSLLSIEAARAAGLGVAGVVLTPWPEEPGDVERSNLETIATLGRVDVHTLGEVYTGPPISSAGDLPLEQWIGRKRPAAPRQRRGNGVPAELIPEQFARFARAPKAPHHT
jgi:dethiobiotin synthetase